MCVSVFRVLIIRRLGNIPLQACWAELLLDHVFLYQFFIGVYYFTVEKLAPALGF